MERLTKRVKSVVVPIMFDLDFALDMPDKEWACLRAVFDRLAAYEDTGLEPGDVETMRESKADAEFMLRDLCKFCDYDRLEELAQADREGCCVVLQEKVLPLVWGDAFHNTVLCPNCERDLMGGFADDGGCDVAMFQCPHCGQPIDSTKAVTREEADAALETQKAQLSEEGGVSNGETDD